MEFNVDSAYPLLLLLSYAYCQVTTIDAERTPDSFMMSTSQLTVDEETDGKLDTSTDAELPSSGSSGSEKEALYYVVTVYNYWSCVVPAVAIVANLLSILVFASRGQKEQTVNMLLLGLAIADTLSLLSTMDVAVHFLTEHSWMQHTAIGCKLIQYVTSVARDSSSFITLTFTIDRFVAVQFPLERASLMTRRRVQIAMVAIVLLSATFETYWIIGLYHNKEYNACYTPSSKGMAMISTVIRNISGFMIPGVLVAILNALIIKRLQEYQAHRSSMTSVKKCDIANRSLTITLITVSTFSFIVYLPKVLFFLYLAFGSLKYNETEFIAAYVTDGLCFLNYTCSFFLYSLSGPQFRRDLKYALLNITFCGGKLQVTLLNIIMRYLLQSMTRINSKRTRSRSTLTTALLTNDLHNCS